MVQSSNYRSFQTIQILQEWMVHILAHEQLSVPHIQQWTDGHCRIGYHSQSTLKPQEVSKTFEQPDNHNHSVCTTLYTHVHI